MKDAYKPVWVILFIIVGMAALVGIARMRSGSTGAAADANERIPWTADLSAARAKSAEAGKPILLYFTASWCGPCQRMKQTTWADQRVAAAVERYFPVKIDIDEQGDVARQFGVNAVPRVEVVAASGERQLITEGAVDADRLLALLQQASPSR